MKLLQQLRAALEKALRDQEAVISKTIEKDGSVRAFSAEEQAEYDGLSSSVESLKEQIKRAQANLDEQNEIAKTRGSTSAAPKIQVIRQENENEEGEYRGFKHFGEQLQSIGRSLLPNGSVDERLNALEKSVRAVTGHNEGTGSDGGFIVQTDFQTSLYKKTQEASIIAGLCETVTLGANSNSLEWNEFVEDSRVTGSRNGGVRVYRDKEGGDVSSSGIKLRRDRLVAEKLSANAYVTEELLEDASALQTMIEPAFVDEMAFTLDEEIINGDGAGECLGILNSPALVTVAKEGGQTAATVNYLNVTKMEERLWSGSEGKAQWFIGSGVKRELNSLSFTPPSGTSIPVYMPANGISGSPYASLFASPLKRNEHCSALGTVGDIIYADFSKYRLVRKGGLKGSMSIHVRFLNGEIVFRWVMRVNGKPMWKLPLTPAKGSLTESPFVALATRA